MNYLEKLLDGVGVEWKTLGEVTDFTNGKGHEKGITEDGKYIVVNSKFISTNGKVAKFSEEQICPLFCEDILIVMSDLPNGKALSKTFFVEENDKYTLNQRIGGIRVKDSNILFPKFLNYFLNRTPQLLKFDDGASQTNLRKDQIQGVIIPIPSLKIQQKIVAILDTFTELTAELTARKMQYSYYREKLLTFDENEVEWKRLEQVAEYSKERISYDNLDTTNYVGVDNLLQNREGKTNSNYVPQLGNSTKYNTNDILIGNIRPYLKKIWHADQDGGTNGDVLVVKLTNKNINPRYLYQVLAADNFFEYNMQHAKGAKMPRGNKEKIMEYQIPIPSLKEQERVVSILDKFEILTNSISEGLPKEIELRQKQYEYYRDLLLTFNN